MRHADHEDQVVEDFHEFVARKVGSRRWAVSDGQEADTFTKLGVKANEIIQRARFEELRAEFEEQSGEKVR